MRIPYVDLWWSDLREMDLGLVQLLDPVETRRAREIERPADLGRFVLGAALLRVAVAAASGLGPREVAVDRTCDECSGPHGRPRVPDGHASVAHAGPLVLVATSAVPVGVDVESTARGDGIEQWVREEATFKATGSRDGHAVVVEVPPPLPGYLAALAAPLEAVVTVHSIGESARALEALRGRTAAAQAR